MGKLRVAKEKIVRGPTDFGKPVPAQSCPACGTAHAPEKREPVSRLREARYGGRRKVGKDHAQIKTAAASPPAYMSSAGALWSGVAMNLSPCASDPCLSDA